MISSAARYGIRTLLHIASNADKGIITTAEISERQRIPRAFLAKVVEQLVHAGLLTSQRGAHGGLSLARPVHKINLLEIVEAIDGPIAKTPCAIRREQCICNRNCPIYEGWEIVKNDFASLLKTHTLESVLCGKKLIHAEADGASVYV